MKDLRLELTSAVTVVCYLFQGAIYTFAVIGFCLLMFTISCASMETKQSRARETAEIGLASHPELEQILASLRRLEDRLDTLVKFQGDVLEHEQESRVKLQETLDALRAELAKGRPHE